MTTSTLHTAAILLIVVPTIEYGGYSLVRMIAKRDPAYVENTVRRALFRAGHAHAGVLLIFALVALSYVDATGLGGTGRAIVRWGFTAAPILMPFGFFLSVAAPRSDRPNRLILFTYLGGLALAVAAVTLGVGLLKA